MPRQWSTSSARAVPRRLPVCRVLKGPLGRSSSSTGAGTHDVLEPTAECSSPSQVRRGRFEPNLLSAKQCPRSVSDEVGALLWHPVTTAADDLEGQVSPMGPDLLEHRHGDVEVISAEQQPRRSLEPLPLEFASQQDRLRQAQVVPVQPRAAAVRARSRNCSAYTAASAWGNSAAWPPSRINQGMKPGCATTCSPRIGVATSPRIPGPPPEPNADP
jgi:hypothetical protein